MPPTHNVYVLGKGRGFGKPEFKKAIDDLSARYQTLIFDHALSPGLLTSFEDRLRHARDAGRDPDRFLDEELSEFKTLEAKIQHREHTTAVREEARRRRLAGESFADKVLDEYRQRIEHYPAVDIHPDADPEVTKIYGAMGFFDRTHWSFVETFLRRAFPQAGQLDRMSIEQRFWRFVSSRKGRLPEELERYRRTLAAPSATKKEKIKEAQEAIKSVSFFLHELLDVCERAVQEIDPDEDTQKAMNYVRDMIADFRIKDLKRR